MGFLVVIFATLLSSSYQARLAAAAADDVVETISAEQLMTLMQREGYAVELHEAGFVLWKIDGYRSHLFIADDAEAIQFHISFGDGNATLKKVNEWNATKRFSRTYLDEDGDPHLELDLDLEGGVTEKRIADYLRTCKVSLSAWCSEVVE